MNLEELKTSINDWMTKYPNPYNNHIEEKVYWNMLDILFLLKEVTPETKDNIVQICNRMYNRFKYYY